jgi:2Fe-2S ferredoxin
MNSGVDVHMTAIKVLPHTELCPNGATLDAEPGTSVCNALLAAGIPIDHACEKACACTTCHVIVRQGFETLASAEEKEEDMLDKAWGVEPNSRLSCQALVGQDELTIEIPRYTINMVSEHR